MLSAPTPFDDIHLPLDDRRDGKVRVSYALSRNRRLFVTTDRLSAFDRIIAAVPYKGQVLNQLSAWWFEQTADIIANHMIAVPDPNVLIARSATPLPVEVVVRGHITGVTDTSLWTRYAAGERVIDGHALVDGLLKNSRLDAPIITPTTKGDAGAGDSTATTSHSRATRSSNAGSSAQSCGAGCRPRHSPCSRAAPNEAGVPG